MSRRWGTAGHAAGRWRPVLAATAVALAGTLVIAGFATAGAAAPWTYHSLDLLLPGAAAGQLASAGQGAGNLTRVRIGESSYYTRLVLDFDARTRFVVAPITDRTLEITLLKLQPGQIAARQEPSKGLIGAYRFEPDGADGTRLIVQAKAPISISAMGDLAPDKTIGRYRLFFDFVQRGQPLTNPAFVQREPKLPEARPRPRPQPGLTPRGEDEAFLSADIDPRDQGVYLRATGSLAWSTDTGGDLATISSDAGSGYALAAALGYRPLPFLRLEVEGGYFGGFEVENAAGSADVHGYYAALNGFIALSRAFWTIRPYLGAGIGISQSSIGDLTGGTAPAAGGNDDVGFLWQLFAGAEVQVVDNLSADLGYRFAHRGEVGSETAANGATYDGDLRSHEVYLGVIYDF